MNDLFYIMPVFKYRNYRVFFKDRSEAYKRCKQGFSCWAFSKKAVLSSPSTLREAISGNAGITGASLPGYVKGLGLNKCEAEYFSALVRCNQAVNEAVAYKTCMVLLNIERRMHAVTLSDSQFGYCSEWYYSVIRH